MALENLEKIKQIEGYNEFYNGVYNSIDKGLREKLKIPLEIYIASLFIATQLPTNYNKITKEQEARFLGTRLDELIKIVSMQTMEELLTNQLKEVQKNIGTTNQMLQNIAKK